MRTRFLLILTGLGFLAACKPEAETAVKAAERAARELSAEEKAEVAGQKVGGALQGKLYLVKEGKFEKAGFVSVPRYYLLYFSASW